MEQEIVKAISLTYAEGRFFDIWMFVHFLAGVFAGFAALRLEFSKVYAYTIATLSFILWELLELLWGIEEVWTNIFLDVLVAIVGIVFVFSFRWGGRVREKKLFIYTTIIFVVMSLVGWMVALLR